MTQGRADAVRVYRRGSLIVCPKPAEHEIGVLLRDFRVVGYGDSGRGADFLCKHDILFREGQRREDDYPICRICAARYMERGGVLKIKDDAFMVP